MFGRLSHPVTNSLLQTFPVNVYPGIDSFPSPRYPVRLIIEDGDDTEAPTAAIKRARLVQRAARESTFPPALGPALADL